MTLNEVLNKIDWISGSKERFIHETFNKNNTEYIIFKGNGILTYVNGIKEEYTVRLETYEPTSVIEFLIDHVNDIYNWNQGWMISSEQFVSKERLVNEIWNNGSRIEKDYGIPVSVICDIVEQCCENIYI